MSEAQDNFKKVVPKYMVLFMKDFDCNEDDASAVFGNAGYESLGFTKLQEMKPTVAGSKGGYGWFQWTGPRRVDFEAYCKRNNLDPSSNDANYKFLFVELKGSESKAIPALKSKIDLDNKVIAFEKAYERAGVKAYLKRQEWARIARTALEEHLATTVPPTPTIAPTEHPQTKETPSTMNVIVTSILGSVIRHVTTALGSALAASGLFSGDEATTLTGAAGILLSVGWSLVDAWLKAKVKK